MTDHRSRPQVALPALAVATACGVGYVPFAPGTFGSAVGVLLWAVIPASATITAAVIVLLFVVGAWSGTVTERHLGTTDPGPVVVDEVMGMLITLFMNPVGWAGLAAGFLFFRLFDIVKPYPARHLERLPGGLGIMADDAMAAVYANLLLRVALAIGSRVIG